MDKAIKQFWNKYYNPKRTPGVLYDFLSKDFKARDKKVMKDEGRSGFFKFNKISTIDFIYDLAKKTPFKSNEGHDIYMLETSFHEMMLICENVDFINEFKDTTGAFSICIRTRDKNKETETLGYYIVIDSDVYDYCEKYDFIKYVKYFTISHEIGHCINDDPIHQLDLPDEIAHTGDRMEVQECIDREINADIIGYKEVILSKWFGDFYFPIDLVLGTKYRKFQHVLNWMFCIYGKENLNQLRIAHNIEIDRLDNLGRKFLDTSVYRYQSSEDIARQKVFRDFFKKVS